MNSKPGALLAAAWLGVSIAAAVHAAPIDLHAQWDQRCVTCHGHAGEFARRWLTVEQGRLVGHHHRENLAGFLRNHYVADDLVEPMMQMLAAQVAQPPVFQARCVQCHGTAAEFARRSLEWRNGLLHGRASGKPVAEFLKAHGGLGADEIAAMVETLGRVRREVTPGS